MDSCQSSITVEASRGGGNSENLFILQIQRIPSGSNDSSGIVNDNLRDSAKSDLRVSLVDNGLVGPYSATVLVTLSSAPDHRPPRLASAR
ncbi:hypothetical protein TNCV_2293541 [Trichonephila clavipes]|nr:hypothetical protein TNCV_2293541 [Trichonephila clavipes]